MRSLGLNKCKHSLALGACLFIDTKIYFCMCRRAPGVRAGHDQASETLLRSSKLRRKISS